MHILCKLFHDGDGHRQFAANRTFKPKIEYSFSTGNQFYPLPKKESQIKSVKTVNTVIFENCDHSKNSKISKWLKSVLIRKYVAEVITF